MLLFVKYDLEQNRIYYNSFEEIENYDKVVYIDYCNNQLTSLPKLPNSLQQLLCKNNQLKLLPELPNSLKILICYNNKLTSLPELPNSLKYLWCNNNKFIKKLKYKYLNEFVYMYF